MRKHDCGVALYPPPKVGGFTATEDKTIAVDLKNAGAQFEDKSVVIDGNLITSRQPEDIPDFAEAIDQALTK